MGRPAREALVEFLLIVDGEKDGLYRVLDWVHQGVEDRGAKPVNLTQRDLRGQLLGWEDVLNALPESPEAVDDGDICQQTKKI